MAKSIHERVRATLAKQAAAEKKAEDAKKTYVTGRQIAAAVRAERRIEGIANGTIMPRNAAEEEIQYRALYE